MIRVFLLCFLLF
uniref:Uncharacterized protein n=1 Tax=Arundo donax TaxID=35708 RepID=A0A0A9C5K4_ARUDO